MIYDVPMILGYSGRFVLDLRQPGSLRGSVHE